MTHGATLTPDCTEVLASIVKGEAYLKADSAQENRPGGKALIGLPLIKAGADTDHPLITATVEEIRKNMATGKISFQHPIYRYGHFCDIPVVTGQNQLKITMTPQKT